MSLICVSLFGSISERAVCSTSLARRYNFYGLSEEFSPSRSCGVGQKPHQLGRRAKVAWDKADREILPSEPAKSIFKPRFAPNRNLNPAAVGTRGSLTPFASWYAEASRFVLRLSEKRRRSRS